MSDITQTQWNEMSAVEKRDYIINTPWEIEKRSGLNGNARVGDHKNAIITQFSVVSGAVQISNWHDNQVDAVKEAVESAEEYIKEAE